MALYGFANCVARRIANKIIGAASRLLNQLWSHLHYVDVSAGARRLSRGCEIFEDVACLTFQRFAVLSG